jgi:rhombotail lipoprotein
MKPWIATLLVCALSVACNSTPAQRRAGVLDYLYPSGAKPEPPQDVHLAIPLRVGVAFAPASSEGQSMSQPLFTLSGGFNYGISLDESDKQRLLQRVVDAFKGTEGVQSIQIIPSTYLKPGGGFENVDQLRSLLGIDLIAILSYEQSQYQEYNKASFTYWTLVGAYVVKGNKNDTHTFVDTSVFDIPSRALLFNAAGQCKNTASATALEASEQLRKDSLAGFQKAVDDMIVQLQGALVAFREQGKSGTVHGAGTPGLSVSHADGAGGGGGTGAGASGLELLAAFALLACASRRRAALG